MGTLAPTSHPASEHVLPGTSMHSRPFPGQDPMGPSRAFGNFQRAENKDLGACRAGPGQNSATCPALALACPIAWEIEKRDGISLSLNPKRNRFGWLGRCIWRGLGKKRKQKPSTDRLSQLVAIVRCTRHNLVARHSRLSAIPPETLDPKRPKP